ncbi:MAG: hypothetical protein ACK4HQ_08985 [Brevinematales bacterium]
MRKYLCFVLFVSSFYGWYGDAGFQLTPIYVILNDGENTTYGYGIYGLEGRGRFFLSRDHGIDVILKDTLIVLTNLTNTWEIRRFVWESKGNEENLLWGMVLGRDRFSLDEGRLFEKSADGLGGYLLWNGMRIEGLVGYAGFTEWVESNRPASTLTNHRLYTGVSTSFPLWLFSFVRMGIAGSVDMRTNFRITLVDVAGGVQGSASSWIGYSAHFWYEMGEVVLTNIFVPEKVSAWATEEKIVLGKKNASLQGMLCFLAASGENSSSQGWNRFSGLGRIEGPVVFAHSIANLWMIQGKITWREKRDRFLLSVIYGILSRFEKTDITLVPLYGNGNLLGHEFAIQTVLNIDPSVSFFAMTGLMMKGDAFAINKEKSLYQVSVGINISL